MSEHETIEIGSGAITDFAFSLEEPYPLLIGINDGRVLLFDMRARRTITTWECSGGPIRVGWIGSMPIAWLSTEREARGWSLDSGGATHNFEIPTEADLAPTDDGFFVASTAVRLMYYEPRPGGSWLREKRELPARGGHRLNTLTSARSGAVALDSGARVQFQSGPDGAWQLLEFEAYAMALSPVGDKIAFVVYTGDAFRLLHYPITNGRVDEASQRMVVLWDKRPQWVQWSNDGTAVLVYTSDENDVRVLRVLSGERLTSAVWTTSFVRPRFDPRGALVTVPQSLDRLIVQSLDGVVSKVWIQTGSSVAQPASFEILGSPQMKRGDKVVVFAKKPTPRPLAVYEVVSGLRKDEQDQPGGRVTPATCKLLLGLPTPPDEVLKAHRDELQSMSAADRDTRELRIHSRLLSLLARIFENDANVVERLRQLLGEDDSTALSSTPSGLEHRAPVRIESIRLRNLRVLRELDLVLPGGTERRGQWVVLLGENGTGKTTLLRAIALALSPSDHATTMLATLTSHAPLASGTPAVCEVLTDRGPGAFEVIRATDRERAVFTFQAPDDLPLFAYGTSRGNALGGPKRESSPDRIGGIATLFDLSASLIHADTWLRDLALAWERNSALRPMLDGTVATLLALLPGTERLEIGPEQTLLDGIPLNAYSDGYLTTLGWTVDFIARWAARARARGLVLSEDFAHEMEAIVLIDELDLHLHPRWQAEVVTRLRRTFPATTFLATTHNPLTLHGTEAGEVFILRRGEAGIEVLQRDLPPGVRADQILTGDWFGLDSTLDEGTRDLLRRHRELLRTGVDQDNAERVELERTLRDRLGRYAETSVERVAQEIAATVVSDDRPITPTERATVEDLVRAKLGIPEMVSIAAPHVEVAPTTSRKQRTKHRKRPKR